MTTTEQTISVEDQTLEQDPRLVALAPYFRRVETNIHKYQALNSQYQAATGDREAAVKAWMAGSEDEEATAIREAIKRAEAKLKLLAEAAVGETNLSEQEVAKLKAELEVAEKKLKASSRALRGLAEPFEVDVTPMLDRLGDPFLPKQTSATAGTGLPRPSVYVEVTKNHNDKLKMTFENLSGAAKAIDLDVKDLGKLYAEAAGVAYEEIAKVKEPQEFEWQNSTLKDAPHWTIKTTPKESNRGRQAVTSTTTVDNSDNSDDVA